MCVCEGKRKKDMRFKVVKWRWERDSCFAESHNNVLRVCEGAFTISVCKEIVDRKVDMICLYCLRAPTTPPLPAITRPLFGLSSSHLLGHEESWDWDSDGGTLTLCVASLSLSSSNAYWEWMTRRTEFRLERTSSSASKVSLPAWAHTDIYACMIGDNVTWWVKTQKHWFKMWRHVWNMEGRHTT